MCESLADKIVSRVQCGRLCRRFRVADIRPLFGEFEENHIRTVLANYAEGGNMVIRGQRARFHRVSKGLYEVLQPSIEFT